MTSQAFDAIVIGGGHNGLTLALYLQRAGLATLLLEQASDVGGMTRTEEPLLPGFRHNPHANILQFLDIMPVVRDFGLGDLGLRTLAPEAQHGICFSDGRPPVILHRCDLAARTAASLSAYSTRDAEMYAALKAAIDPLGDLLAAGLFAPASRSWFSHQADVLRHVAAAVGAGAGLGGRTAQALIDDLFEASEVRALMYQLAAEFGVAVGQEGGDISFLGLALWIVGRWRLPVGGMQAVPDALRRAADREGVTVATGHRVSRIDVLNGRARSVFVPGHGRIQARRLVASSADLAHTLLDLVGSRGLSGDERRAVRQFAATPAPALASLMFCLAEPPAYRSARWDGEINRCFHTVVGFDGPEEALAHLADVEAGLPPAPAAAVRVATLWDPSQAPAGRHVASSDAFMPSLGSLDADSWDVVRASYNDAFVERWAEFAPNISRRTVLADRFDLPGGYERKMRFREGSNQYRTEVGGLYLCGAATYPGGGVHGACGYNAYQAIAEDLGLPPPGGGAAQAIRRPAASA